MSRWYDPIAERWHAMPEPAKPAPATVEPENPYEAAARKVRIDNIWQAVVSTAAATTTA